MSAHVDGELDEGPGRQIGAAVRAWLSALVNHIR